MTTTINGKATELITFSRASLATVTDGDRIKWAPHNLLLASEQFDASNWSITGGATITANSTAAPNGTTTADTIAFTTTGYRYQNVSYGLLTGLTMTAGVWLWSDTGKATILLRLSGAVTPTDQAATLVTLTTTPTLYTVTRTFTSTDTVVTLGLENRTAVGGDGIAGNVIAWGAHLYRSDLGGMAANASAYPYYNPSTRKNLLGFSEAISNAAWVAFGGSGSLAPSKGTTSGTRPNGTIGTIDTLTFPAVNSTSAYSGVFQSGGATFLNTPVTFSVYARVPSGAGILYLNLEDINVVPTGSNFVAGSVNNLTTTWQRISLTGTRTSVTGNLAVVIGFDTRVNAGQTNAASLTVELWGAQLSDSASLDPYVGSYGAAPTAAAYHGPRLDYNASTLAPLGLLVEEQRTNIAVHSEDFGNALWGKTACSVTTNSTTAPSGSATADTLVEDATTATHQLAQFPTLADNTTYAFSVYAKAAGRNWMRLNATAKNGTGYSAYFNLSSGTTGASTTAGATAVIISVGSGWYRCTMTYPSSTGATTTGVRIATASDDNVLNYLGDGSSGVYIWGAQLEAGSFATSYIPTAASTVTRSADVASVATSQFPYSATEGSWVANFQTIYSGTAGLSYFLLSLDGNNSKRVLYIPGGSEAATNSDGVNILTATGDVTGSISKSASAYDASSKYIVSNGGTVASGSVVAGYATASTVSLGCLVAANQLNGHIRQITYIPRRLSASELQARTA